MARGAVYWITGLAGVGKSTLAKHLYETLKLLKPNVVLLDGDNIREVFDHDLGYSSEERLKSARRNSRLSKLLSDQGIDVICATISLFHEFRTGIATTSRVTSRST